MLRAHSASCSPQLWARTLERWDGGWDGGWCSLRTHFLRAWPGSSPDRLNCVASHLQKGPGPQGSWWAHCLLAHPLPWASRRGGGCPEGGHHTPSQAQRPPSMPQRTWLVCFCTIGSLLFYPNPVSPCRPEPTAQVCQWHQVGALGMCGAPSLSEGAEPAACCPHTRPPGWRGGGQPQRLALGSTGSEREGPAPRPKASNPLQTRAAPVPRLCQGSPHLPGLYCQPLRKPLAGASPLGGWQLPCHLCRPRRPVWQGLGEGAPAKGRKLAESTCAPGVPESGSAGGKGHLETRPPHGAVRAPEARPVLLRPLPACGPCSCSPGRGRPWGGCASAWSRRSVSFVSLSFSAVY